jgi:hypothetical protein
MDANTASTVSGFDVMWTAVLMWVPRSLAFLAILLVGFLVINMLARALDLALRKSGFNKAIERGGVGRFMTESAQDSAEIASRVAYYAMAVIVLQMAFSVFGPNPISDLLTRLIAFMPNIFAAAAILIGAGLAATVVKPIVSASLGNLNHRRALAEGTAVALVIVGVFAALNQLGVAPQIVSGLFYAMLAVIAGSAIVAIGGGGIVPMRGVWERTINSFHESTPPLKMEYAAGPQQPASKPADSARFSQTEPLQENPHGQRAAA